MGTDESWDEKIRGNERIHRVSDSRPDIELKEESKTSCIDQPPDEVLQKRRAPGISIKLHDLRIHDQNVIIGEDYHNGNSGAA